MICLSENLIKEPIKVGNVGLDLGGIVEHDGVIYHGGVIIRVEFDANPTFNINNVIRTFNTLICKN